LIAVDGVNSDLELSTLTEIINERSKIDRRFSSTHQGLSKGYRVVANLVSSVDRLALTLGMKPGVSEI
jgi:3-polyprenyl-4-hydroxybenzoate decarboxylase